MKNPFRRDALKAALTSVSGGFLGLRIALFAAGKGDLRARRFRYRGRDT